MIAPPFAGDYGYLSLGPTSMCDCYPEKRSLTVHDFLPPDPTNTTLLLGWFVMLLLILLHVLVIALR